MREQNAEVALGSKGASECLLRPNELQQNAHVSYKANLMDLVSEEPHLDRRCRYVALVEEDGYTARKQWLARRVHYHSLEELKLLRQYIDEDPAQGLTCKNAVGRALGSVTTAVSASSSFDTDMATLCVAESLGIEDLPSIL